MENRKMRPETAKYTAIILLILGGLGFTVSGLVGSYGLMLFFLIPLLAASAVDIIYWRCPHCGSHLGVYWNDYCSRCGERNDL